MGSYFSSVKHDVSATDDVRGDGLSTSAENEKSLSSFFPIEVSRKCSFCLNDLPEDGEYVTCKYCQNNFHFGKCSVKKPKNNENKPYNKWTCPKCKKSRKTADLNFNEEGKRTISIKVERKPPKFLEDLFSADNKVTLEGEERQARQARRRGIRVPKKPVFMPRMRPPAPPPFPF